MIYNVALIGYGYWGPKLGRNFYNSSKFKIKKIVDLSNKNLLKAKKILVIFLQVKTIKILKNCDLVVIATTTNPFQFSFIFFKKRVLMS